MSLAKNTMKLEIPEFSVVACPGDQRWPKRIKEEMQIFQIWRDRCKTLYCYAPFDNLRRESGGRRFTCIFRFPKSRKRREVELVLPLDYPKVPPRVSKGNLGVYPFVKIETSRVDDFFVTTSISKEPCLGALENLWRRDGRWGIAHFLDLLCVYVSIFLED